MKAGRSVRTALNEVFIVLSHVFFYLCAEWRKVVSLMLVSGSDPHDVFGWILAA